MEPHGSVCAESGYIKPGAISYRFQIPPDPKSHRKIPEIYIFRKIQKSENPGSAAMGGALKLFRRVHFLCENNRHLHFQRVHDSVKSAWDLLPLQQSMWQQIANVIIISPGYGGTISVPLLDGY